MKQEEYLDYLIEQHDCWEDRPLLSDPEITAILVAVKKLARIREIDVPADFARRLEASIRAHSRVQHGRPFRGHLATDRPTFSRVVNPEVPGNPLSDEKV